MARALSPDHRHKFLPGLFRRALALGSLLALTSGLPAALASALPDFSPIACESVFGAPDSPAAGGEIRQRSLSDGDLGTVVAYGSVATLKFAHPLLARVQQLLPSLSGHSTDTILVAKAISGSTARLALTGTAHDIDMEATLIIREAGPMASGTTMRDLFRPDSIALKSVAQFLTNHVRTTLQSHPEFRFIELKAGTYVDSSTGKTEGIKWSQADLFTGQKTVIDNGVTKTVQLTEALAEDARIKMDWAVPSPFGDPRLVDGGPDYIEASTLYRIGIQAGNNQPRLRIGPSGTPIESLPFRITTLALSLEDFQILRDLSSAVPPKPIEETHQSLQLSEFKHPGDFAKQLKRTFTLLQFFESVPDFNLLTGSKLEQPRLLQDILEILTQPEIRLLGDLKAQGQLLEVLEAKGITVPGAFAQRWRTRTARALGAQSSTSVMVEALGNRMNTLLKYGVSRRPGLAQFIRFVVDRSRYLNEPLSASSRYAALTPNAATLTKLRDRIQTWKIKFDRIHFDDIKSLHATLHFLGRVTPSTEAAVQHALSELPQSWQFDAPGLRVMGRNRNLVAIAFRATDAQSQAVERLRATAYAVGALPEKTFRDFLPHVTLGRFDRSDPLALRQVNSLLAEVSVGDIIFESDHGPRIKASEPKDEASP